ncbi:MAG TPA: LysM peptidoglycan-binding domain-containing protein [Candidatus Saccharibacteria bacterium]|nr:LysM peptidoglycan-binding domain-containing protein [Candidatus Saccharibacteria bacterium]
MFVAAIAIVAMSYKKPESITATASVSDVSRQQGTSDTSVNEVVATSIAANVAEAANLPVANNVANLSVSLAAKNEITPSSTTTSVSKQQIVQPTGDRRELVTYVAKTGDTVDTVSARYGVSKDTIKWANNLTSDALDVDKELTIPPVDGVVYTVKDGDTVAKLAEKYKASEARIIAFNDLELQGIAKDTKIIIPGGQLPETERPGYVAPRPVWTGGGGSSSNTSSLGNFMSGSVGNRYVYGYCTWYAYERRAQMGRPVGSFWGNANTWAAAARAQGYVVNSTPAPGAVFQTSYGGGGYGHVGIIDSVDYAAGTVTYRDMNGIAGWNRIGSGTVSIADAQSRWTFIH